MPTSATLWSLMDRWQIPDEEALELVGFEGKLPTTSRRPRFKLSPEQERTVSTLPEIDTALSAAGFDGSWLSRKHKRARRTPLDLMRAGTMDEVLPLITATMVRASVRKKAR
ncbi:MAG: hypothetical protein QOD93_4262 [Acetobacteraceae bacterium]|jgi:hypothetical protein|nr:hypothetical protein [Acetobacteraceae bacterium]MEA2771300.1 hypothetical protein [Acetobacteraceae bacterium]